MLVQLIKLVVELGNHLLDVLSLLLLVELVDDSLLNIPLNGCQVVAPLVSEPAG